MQVLLNELIEIQEREGYISEENICITAEKYNMQKAKLYGIISFYSRLYTKKQAEYIIRVCKSVSCGINKSDEIIKKIKEYLNIEEGQITSDGKFKLELIECLGHCGEGPVMTINDIGYCELDAEKTEEVLKSYLRRV